MSARMLQRALRNHEAETPVVASHVDSSDSDGDEKQGSLSNPFDLLGFQEDEDESEDGGDVERDSHQQSVAGSASTSATAVPARASKLKRKKNKKGKKGKEDPSLDERRTTGTGDEEVDELQESPVVGISEGSSSISGGSRSNDGAPHRKNSGEAPNILCVDVKHLKAADELRRIFGSKVINSAERRGEGPRAQRRYAVGGRRSGRGGMPFKKSMLVVPMEHWPPWDGGMTMECHKVEGRTRLFRYQYSVAYEGLQKQFETCVASHDPNTIVMLLNNHPYHVDSLLALSELYKQMGEHQQAADLLEKCLYALECAWHPWFTPATGSCRLEFSWDANKAFFLTLFRHMQHLGRQGCHRTALEVCKFLLSLDPSDPLGTLFCIDYFSLRAEQYEWLEHFVDEYQTDKPTLLLPNFSFSVAVAGFYLEEQQRGKPSQRANNNNMKGEKGSVKSNQSSAVLLQQALMLHPSALRKIIAKASIKEDGAWAKILSHSHFSHTESAGPTLEHLIDIYVERNYLIWRSSELQGWLKEAAGIVTQTSDKILNSKSGLEASNRDCIWDEVFPSDGNEYKHLHVSEYSDSTSVVLPEDVPQLNFLPHRGGFAQEDVLRELPDDAEGLLEQVVAQADFPRRNALLLFLQSLFPRMDSGPEASLEDTPALLEDDNNGND